jgi:hypothetical protein
VIVNVRIELKTFYQMIPIIAQPSAHWNEETRTCIITNTYRGLPNNASMLATDVIFFIVILSGVYQRNSGKHIVITMYHEVRVFFGLVHGSHAILRAYFGSRSPL